MLPLLDKPAYEIGIDILLSSTVILRFFEQISCTGHPVSHLTTRAALLTAVPAHTPSNDPQRHLLAGSVYISSHVDCAISGGLASASFWVFVIQDIQFALTYQKCLRLTFAPFDHRLRQWWVAKPVLSDGDWVNRAIWLLAETIDFCYNVSGRNYGGLLGVAGEHALKQRIHDWEIGRPETFTPLHVSPPHHGRGKPFPVVWYTSLWHCKCFWVGGGSYPMDTDVCSHCNATRLPRQSAHADPGMRGIPQQHTPRAAGELEGMFPLYVATRTVANSLHRQKSHRT